MRDLLVQYCLVGRYYAMMFILTKDGRYLDLARQMYDKCKLIRQDASATIELKVA